MNFRSTGELSDHLKKTKDLPRIILVQGNQFDNLSEIHNLLTNLVSSRFGPAEHVSLNGTETDPSVFHAELSTIPMFSTPRIILLRHADNLLKKIDTNKTILAYFLRDLENFPESTYLVLQTEGEKIPASLSVLSEKSLILEEPNIRSRDLPDVVRSRCHSMGFEISDEAVMDLTRKYSLNPALVTKALDRLFLYCLHEKKINSEDIRELAFDTDGDFLFDIIDCLAARSTDKAAGLLERSDFSNAAGFFAAMSKFFTDSLRYMKLKKLSIASKDIHERLELNTRHSFIFRKNEERFSQAISAYNEGELLKIIEKLFELDRNIKENNNAGLQKNLVLMFIFFLQRKTT